MIYFQKNIEVFFDKSWVTISENVENKNSIKFVTRIKKTRIYLDEVISSQQ